MKKYSAANNGKVIGEFSVDEIANSVKNGVAISHVYMKESGWILLSDFISAMVKEEIPPPPPPIMQPQAVLINSGIETVVKIVSTLPQVPENSDTSFHGFPKSYWHAFLGENTSKFLDAFKELPTIQEIKANRTRNPGESFLAWHARTKGTNNRAFGFAWVGLVLGWSWLAYRKVWSAFIWFAILDIALNASLSRVSQLQDPSSGTIIRMLLAIVGVLVAPCMFGNYLIHKRAQQVFLLVDEQTNDPVERLTMIRKEGGTSIIWFIAFCIYAGVINALIGNAFL